MDVLQRWGEWNTVRTGRRRLRSDLLIITFHQTSQDVILCNTHVSLSSSIITADYIRNMQVPWESKRSKRSLRELVETHSTITWHQDAERQTVPCTHPGVNVGFQTS